MSLICLSTRKRASALLPMPTSCNLCIDARWQETSVNLAKHKYAPEKTNFASSNPHPPHSRAYGREHGCMNSSMVFEWLGAYDCSTNFALRALSKLHLSASRSQELKHRFRLQKPSPFQKETRRGIKRSCLFTTPSNTKASPFQSLRVHSEHEGTNMKCKPNCAPGATLRKTRMA